MTITAADMRAKTIEQVIAFEHVPGLTKWLHCQYSIGQQRASYRVRALRGRTEDYAEFNDLETAVAAFNQANERTL